VGVTVPGVVYGSMTFMFLGTNAMAVARPMPELAPVTRAIMLRNLFEFIVNDCVIVCSGQRLGIIPPSRTQPNARDGSILEPLFNGTGSFVPLAPALKP